MSGLSQNDIVFRQKLPKKKSHGYQQIENSDLVDGTLKVRVEDGKNGRESGMCGDMTKSWGVSDKQMFNKHSKNVSCSEEWVLM